MASPALTCTMLLAFAGLHASGLALADPQSADDEVMIELAWDSGCFNCHDVHEHIRGPAWAEVARRYRGDEGAFERLVEKVIVGGSGNWGDDAMSPNRRVPEEDIRALVGWLLTLE
jgi:cytochrome c